MTTFTSALIQFERDAKRHFQPNTMSTYIIAIKQFFGSHSKSLDEVELQDVENWVDGLMGLDKKDSEKEDAKKETTICVKIAALKVFFKYCFGEGFIKKDPTANVECLKIPESLPGYFDRVTMFKLREAAKNNIRDRAILELLYCSGLRVSEIGNVRLEDISWKHCEIKVFNSKGFNEGIVMFTAECSHHLKKYLDTRKEDNPYLFVTKWNKPFTRQGLWKLVKGYVKLAGVDKSISPHSFRHSFATNMAEKNAPFEVIQDFLRVKDPKTATIYAKLTDQVRKEKYDKYR